MPRSSIKIDFARDALLVIDMQPTFMPGGGLPVTGGDLIAPTVKKLIQKFPRELRFATKDIHPVGHISLASSYLGFAPNVTVLTPHEVCDWSKERHRIAPQAQFTADHLKGYLEAVGSQVLWSDHGIPGTLEAELHPELPESLFSYVLTKGSDPRCDSYSAFIDNLGRSTGLASRFRRNNIWRCIIVGLAEDYCVGWSAQDAREEGFEAVVVQDATKPVDFPPGNAQKIRASFVESGIPLVHSENLIFPN